jgi:hypothetical protein
MNHLLLITAAGLSGFSLTTVSISFANAAAEQAMAFRCYDRATGTLVAESAADITTTQVSCRPIAANDSDREPQGLAARRSINLARGTAVKLNGGLSAYRPASCMFAGATDNPCLTIEDGAFLFNIPGGPPGWEQTGDPPSVQTILKIAADGRSVLDEVYNGPPQNN